jgi:hypothetical protein
VLNLSVTLKLLQESQEEFGLTTDTENACDERAMQIDDATRKLDKLVADTRTRVQSDVGVPK